MTDYQLDTVWARRRLEWSSALSALAVIGRLTRKDDLGSISPAGFCMEATPIMHAAVSAAGSGILSVEWS